MSQATQSEFQQLVEAYYHRHNKKLALDSLRFRNDGLISRAMMDGTGGSVEILCGPAEYHAELFITSLEDGKRWGLAELICIDTVREWLVSYSKIANPADKSALEADIEWTFLILVDGLKRISPFEWLQRGWSST